MSNSVFVSSDQTFEHVCVQVCRNLGFVPNLNGNNISAEPPQPTDYSVVELTPSEVEIRVSEQELLKASNEEEEIYKKLMSTNIIDQEQGLIIMRTMSHTKDEARVSICSSRILSLMKDMIISNHSLLQTNALVSLVNLSIEKNNKLMIVRSGFVPLLIDVLKSSGSKEAKELAVGLFFSLSLEEDNRLPMGVLGAVEPLLHTLRDGESERTRDLSALALHYLSLNKTIRQNLLRNGAVRELLSLVRTGESASQALLVICNLAGIEGRWTMFDANAVAILVEKLRVESTEDRWSSSASEYCVATLLALSEERERFRCIAREVGAVEVLKEVEERGNERAREKAKKILRLFRVRDPEEEEEDGDGEVLSDWDRMLNFYSSAGL